jgi:hypothetical protein
MNAPFSSSGQSPSRAHPLMGIRTAMPKSFIPRVSNGTVDGLTSDACSSCEKDSESVESRVPRSTDTIWPAKWRYCGARRTFVTGEPGFQLVR